MPEFKVLIGGENFAEIRRGKYCYIDKTGFLNDFLPLPAKVTLITRPRRFGKTLFSWPSFLTLQRTAVSFLRASRFLPARNCVRSG